MKNKKLLNWIIISIVFFTPILLFGCVKKEYINIKQFENLKSKERIILLGDSILDFCEMGNIETIKKLTIKGDTTQGILNRIDTVIKIEPDIVFLMVGINDLYCKTSQEEIVKNYEKILYTLNCKTYVFSILPINLKLNKSDFGINEKINKLNNKIKKQCNGKIKFIDVCDKFKDKDGNLSEKYTADGVHLNCDGCLILSKEIQKNTMR